MTPTAAWTTRSALARERRALVMILVVSATAFATLAVIVARALAGTSADKTIARWLFGATDGSSALSAVARLLDLLGGNLFSIALILATTFVLAARRHRYLAAYLFASALGGVLVSTFVKAFVDRPRPPTVGTLIAESTSSFPSGHATSSVATFGALAVVCLVVLRPGVRWWAAGALIGLGLAIGVSRVAVGVHWPTDVLAGWAPGSAWTSAVALIVVQVAMGRSRGSRELPRSSPSTPTRHRRTS